MIRGDIPQNTIDAAYMLSQDFGYIQVSKFGRTTHVELLNAIAQLSHQNCKGIIIDLRENTGGYMEAAIRMVNEFLPEGKLIVYTQGRKYPRMEEYANGTGSCQNTPLVVLIDQGSASASEILPVLSKTTTAAPSSASVRSARDSYSSPSTSATVRPSVSPLPATTPRRAAASSVPTKAATTASTKWTGWTATNTANSSPKTA